jgi:hypothetical protein
MATINWLRIGAVAAGLGAAMATQASTVRSRLAVETTGSASKCGSGTSRVAGDTDDTVDVSAFYSNFDQVRATARQQGGDVVIRLDRNDALVLTGVDIDALTENDLAFA